MKKTAWFSVLTIFVLIPATLYLGSHLKGRWYYLTSTLVILEIMLPFFAGFEARKPQPRELVTLAVMAALATVSRVALVAVPYFKAITGIIMITGIAFGAQAGFLTGAIAAFASNFFFSQGPWTPWQMFAYGFAGFWAGLCFHNRQKLCKPWILGPFGFMSVVLLIGPLLDCCTVFTVLSKLTWAGALVIFGRGLPVNLIHGLGCGVTLVLLTKPLLYKLHRLQVKYGMMSAGEGETP